MQLPEDTHLAYVVAHEAWHWGAYRNADDRPAIFVSAACDDGKGSAWSFTVYQEKHGVQVVMYYDTWAAYRDIPEFFAGLAELEDNTSLEQVLDLLDRLGAVDETKRDRPGHVALVPKMIPPERLDEIDAITNDTPAGPWRMEDDDHDLNRYITCDEVPLDISLGYVGNRTQNLGRFIVMARTEMPRLTARVRYLEGEVARYRADDEAEQRATTGFDHDENPY